MYARVPSRGPQEIHETERATTAAYRLATLDKCKIYAMQVSGLGVLMFNDTAIKKMISVPPPLIRLVTGAVSLVRPDSQCANSGEVRRSARIWFGFATPRVRHFRRSPLPG